METINITSPHFWEDQWIGALDASKTQHAATAPETATPAQPTGSSTPGKSPMARWDKMAKDFAQRTSGEKASLRRQETLDLLTDKGILTPETRVLDIGAGPGSWALPLAKICAHVTALEPSSGMVEIMANRIKAENCPNIRVVQKTWQETDLTDLGWEKGFDLVFASMTPGIDGPSAIDKMISASRAYCYMSGFSGPGMAAQFAPLWEKFFDRPMPKRMGDIIYPFNLLYARGFRPDITFSWWDKEINWDRDHTLRHFLNYFETHMEITPEAEALIADYVDTRCPDGRYVPANPVCRGAMTWSVLPDRKSPTAFSHEA